jgi:cyclohexanecarboxylate-CoA ligase
VLVALEFGFVGGTVLGAMVALLTGASVVLMRKWDAGRCLDLVTQRNAAPIRC